MDLYGTQSGPLEISGARLNLIWNPSSLFLYSGCIVSPRYPRGAIDYNKYEDLYNHTLVIDSLLRSPMEPYGALLEPYRGNYRALGNFMDPYGAL